jgi:chaperonin GroES
VVEAGQGSLSNTGKLLEMSVKKGDTILLPEYGGQLIKLNNEELFIYKDTDIIAKM